MKFRGQCAVLLIIVFLLTITIPVFSDISSEQTAFNSEDVIVFNDDVLEQAVRNKINKPIGELTYSDVSQLDTLEIWSNVSDYQGIQYLTGLKSLKTLSVTRSEDFSLICSLASLTDLSIYDFRLDNFNGIEGLKNLSKLEVNVYYNKGSDQQALALLPENSLKYFKLSHPYTKLDQPDFDFSVLSKQTMVENLDVAGFDGVNTSELSRLTHIKQLRLERNNISNFTFLTNIEDLNTLQILANPVAVLPQLQQDNLWYFNIQNCGLKSMDLFGAMPKLSVLGISENNITDISLLPEKFPALTTLYANYNPVIDISPLNKMTTLTNLQLSNINATDFSALSGLTNLTDLMLSSCKAEDLSFIAELTNLVSLDLSYSGYTEDDLIVIKELTKLRDLRLTSNNIQNFDSLYGNLPAYDLNLSLWGYQSKAYDDVFRAIQYYRNKLAQDIQINNSTELERVHYVYELVKNSFYYNDNSKSETFNLVYGDSAFCVTYSQAIKALLDQMGIENYMLGGTGHAWNVVRIGSNYYHLDATWDDYYPTNNYSYFLVSDNQLNINDSGTYHNWRAVESNVKIHKGATDDGYQYIRQILDKKEPWEIAISSDYAYFIEKSSGALKSTSIYGGTFNVIDSSDVIKVFKRKGKIYYEKQDGTVYRIIDHATSIIEDSPILIQSNLDFARKVLDYNKEITLKFNKPISIANTSGIYIESYSGQKIDVTAEINGNIMTIALPENVKRSFTYTLVIENQAIKSENLPFEGAELSFSMEFNPNYQVVYSQIDKIELDKNEIILAPQMSEAITASVRPSYTSNKNVVWTVTKGHNVASVSDTGLINALSPGTAVIRATSVADVTKYAECNVTVISTDCNSDGNSNIEDLVILSLAYGSAPDSESWDVRADLNGDGVINLSDLAILGSAYGVTK